MKVEAVQNIYKKESNFVFDEIRKSKGIDGYSKLLFVAIDKYLSLDISDEDKFRDWIQNVPHFVGHFWEWRTIDEYIERFYEKAFTGANYLNLIDNSGCMSLVDLFQRYATWKDDLSDFGLTKEHLKWLKSNRFQVIFIWIKATPFLLESDFMKFKKMNNLIKD